MDLQCLVLYLFEHSKVFNKSEELKRISMMKQLTEDYERDMKSCLLRLNLPDLKRIEEQDTMIEELLQQKREKILKELCSEDRREQIKKYLGNHPYITAIQIANIFQITSKGIHSRYVSRMYRILSTNLSSKNRRAFM